MKFYEKGSRGFSFDFKMKTDGKLTLWTLCSLPEQVILFSMSNPTSIFNAETSLKATFFVDDNCPETHFDVSFVAVSMEGLNFKGVKTITLHADISKGKNMQFEYQEKEEGIVMTQCKEVTLQSI